METGGTVHGATGNRGGDVARYVRPDPKRRKLKARIFNERVKIFATSLNAIAIALIGAAVVLPVVRENNIAALAEPDTWAWLAAGTGLHGMAHWVLGALKSED